MGVALPPRHRRVLTAVVLVAALAVGVLAWSAATRDEPQERDTTAQPSASASAERRTRVPRHLRDWLSPGSPLPGPRAGVAVVERVASPVEGHDSVALSLTRGRGARWVLAVARDGRVVTYSDVPEQSRWLAFDQWLDDLVDQEEGGPGLVLADVRPDGTMVAVADGAEVLDQAVDRDHRMGAFRESRRSVFAVALVRWQGHRWFVMSERLHGETTSTAIAARRSGTTARTADDFIEQMSELGARP